MSSRFGARNAYALEAERRVPKEPVSVWRQEWVLPSGAPATSGNSDEATPGVKILKWVRKPETITFDAEDDDEEAIDEVVLEAPPPVTAPTVASSGGLGSIVAPSAAGGLVGEGDQTPVGGAGDEGQAMDVDAEPTEAPSTGGVPAVSGGLGSISAPELKVPESAAPTNVESTPAVDAGAGAQQEEDEAGDTTMAGDETSAPAEPTPQVSSELHPAPDGLPAPTSEVVGAEGDGGSTTAADLAVAGELSVAQPGATSAAGEGATKEDAVEAAGSKEEDAKALAETALIVDEGGDAGDGKEKQTADEAEEGGEGKVDLGEQVVASVTADEGDSAQP